MMQQGNMHALRTGISMPQRLVQVRRVRPRLGISCSAQNVRARWCLDIRYGFKVEAVELLQQWVRDIGSQVGLTKFNTQINSGSLGIPESRLEMEIALDSLAELEAFKANIPVDLHAAWVRKAQHYIIDGSPSWQVYFSCPVLPATSEEEPIKLPMTSAPEVDFRIRPRARPQPQLLTDQSADFDGPNPPSDIPTGPVDWKGDPMIINPGDKMPFDFS